MSVPSAGRHRQIIFDREARPPRRNPLEIGADLGRVRPPPRPGPDGSRLRRCVLWDIAGKAQTCPSTTCWGTVNGPRSDLTRRPGSTRKSRPMWKRPSLSHQGFVGTRFIRRACIVSPGQGAANAEHIDVDLRAYEALRLAMGPEYLLFAVRSSGYTTVRLCALGRALESLEYEWFEDPIGSTTIHGYRRFSNIFESPLMGTELTLGGLPGHVPWVDHACHRLPRGDVVLKGGVTGLLKLAASRGGV